MHWDYEKGNLDEPTKQYTVEACRRVKARGGVVQSFVLGRVFEQENVDWMKEIVREGNVRRIVIKNEEGEQVIEIPLTVGVVGAILLPALAAIGAVAALLSKCTIEVEREEE